MTRWIAAACLAGLGSAVCAQEVVYQLRYDLTLEPGRDRATVSLALGEGAEHVRWMRFTIDPARMEGFEADGKLERDGRHLTWTPPREGGRLQFAVRVSHRRGSGHDARMTEDWAIFRGDDLFPAGRLLKEDSAEAEAELHVHLPAGWSFVTAHERLRPGVYRVENPERGFDRPTGWMAAGRLGTRRDRIAGVEVTVAGPLGQGVRRMDILAFLNWNLPELRALTDELPARLVVVSARDEMWRGGLSGPSSLYLHAERPLLSENGTSTLMHELVHVVTRLRARGDADWIIEGLAEYYSLKLMWRSGTLSKRRYQRAFRQLAAWGGHLELEDLAASRARGPVTARAVLLMRELDREIYRGSDREQTLDAVVKTLVARGEPVDTAAFRATVEGVLGGPSEILAKLP